MGGASAAALGRRSGTDQQNLRGMSDEDLQSKLDKFSKFKGRGGFLGKMFGKMTDRYQSEIDRRSSAANAASAVGDLQGGFSDLGTRVTDLETKFSELSSDPTSIESAIEDPIAEEPIVETPTVGAPTPGSTVGSYRRTPKTNTSLTGSINTVGTLNNGSMFSPLSQKSANAIYGSELERNRSLKR